MAEQVGYDAQQAVSCRWGERSANSQGFGEIIERHLRDSVFRGFEDLGIGVAIVAVSTGDVQPIGDSDASCRDFRRAVAESIQATSDANRRREIRLANQRAGRSFGSECGSTAESATSPIQEQHRHVRGLAHRTPSRTAASGDHALLQAHARDLWRSKPSGCKHRRPGDHRLHDVRGNPRASARYGHERRDLGGGCQTGQHAPVE